MDDDFFNELMGNFNEREGDPQGDFEDMLIKFMHLQNHGMPETQGARQMQMLESMNPERRRAMSPGSTMDNLTSGDMYEMDSTRGNARQQLLNLLRQLGQR